MASSLRQNNPDIADLSDSNRPTKIAERFSSLYDEEWTNAYEALERSRNNLAEKAIIQILLQIVQVCARNIHVLTISSKWAITRLISFECWSWDWYALFLFFFKIHSSLGMFYILYYYLSSIDKKYFFTILSIKYKVNSIFIGHYVYALLRKNVLTTTLHFLTFLKSKI